MHYIPRQVERPNLVMKFDCTTCHGSGSVEEEISTECFHCHGERVVEVDGVLCTCNVCAGGGFNRMRIEKPCSDCEGKGYLEC